MDEGGEAGDTSAGDGNEEKDKNEKKGVIRKRITTKQLKKHYKTEEAAEEDAET